MIEVIYKEEKKEGAPDAGMFAVPRNIRQIGMIRNDFRIYVEDYVYTFLGRIAAVENFPRQGKGCAAVLTGEIRWQEGSTYVFVKGALLAENMEAAADHIDFSEEVWAEINQQKENYFPDQEVVGWFFAQPQIPVMADEILTRAHIRSFGAEKVLMLLEPTEREDAFFCFENGSLARQSGYYIYYEKNPLMQTYMIEKNQEQKIAVKEEETTDDAVRTFRRIIQSKKKEEPQETEEHTSVFSYAATACLAIAALAVGVNFYQNFIGVSKTVGEAKTASVVVTREETQEETPAPALSVSPTATPISSATKTVTMTPIPSVTPIPTTVQIPTVTPVSAAAQAKSSQDSQTQTDEVVSIQESYVIRPGDTLYQISLDRYGSMDAIQSICELNGLSPEEIIYPGQIIVLP
jgi:LysM repeat protein